MHVVIVGAGIAGSSVARAARAAGLDVTVIAHGTEHSRAAAALLRAAYHAKRPGEVELFARSLALYKTWGVRLAAGAWVTNYRTPEREPRFDEDWYLLDPAAPLIRPDLHGHASATRTGIDLDGEPLTADAVVWCTGAVTGTGVTYGVTWVHDDPEVLSAPERLRIHHFAPYKTIAAGLAGGGVRLGSSSANDGVKAFEQARKMLASAEETGTIRTRTGWRPVGGQRCKHTVTTRHGIHYSLAALHRTGYALAPALAENLVRELLADAAKAATTSGGGRAHGQAR